MVGMTMGVMDGLGVVLAVTGTFPENFHVLRPIPFGIVQVMGGLEGYFLADLGIYFFH
jgi:hypothetical protein